jgi:hypothetical protein
MGISRENHLFIRTINLSLLMVMFFFADVSKIFADNFYGSIGIYGNHHLASRVASIRSNGKFSFDNILSITADGSFAAMPLLKTQRLDVSHLSRVIGPLSEKLYSPQVRISNATNPDTSRSSTLNQSISNASSNAVYELRISTTADRTNSILLSEAVLKSKVYIYVQAPTAISSIDFFLRPYAHGHPR